MLLILVIFVCVNLFPSMTLEHVECTEDYSQKHTAGLNQYFAKNTDVKNGLMIGGGLACDILVIGLMTMWTIWGRSWRLPIALVGLYLCRLFCAVSIC